ncbi:acetyltransferase [Yersinia pseudotuberculosis]|nr:acetyltransferase [Yersinia pseudotuberculosis]
MMMLTVWDQQPLKKALCSQQVLFRLLTNPDDAILNGEDRQRSKASAPRMARLEPTWMYLRRLYDLPVLSVAGTLSITSKALCSQQVLFLLFQPKDAVVDRAA